MTVVADGWWVPTLARSSARLFNVELGSCTGERVFRTGESGLPESPARPRGTFAGRDWLLPDAELD